MGKKNQRKEALLRARRKFLKISAGAAGATFLASCGGAFVKPTKEQGALSVSLRDVDKGTLRMLGALAGSESLRKTFAEQPSAVMKEYGVLPSNTNVETADRILFYVLSNKQLMDQLTSAIQDTRQAQQIERIAEKHGDNSHNYFRAINKFIEYDLINSTSGKEILIKQTEILLSDKGIQEILNIDSERSPSQLAQSLWSDGQSSRLAVEPRTTVVFVVGYVVVFLAVKYAAVLHVVYGVNVAAEVNAVTSGIGDPLSEHDLLGNATALQQWEVMSGWLSQIRAKR